MTGLLCCEAVRDGSDYVSAFLSIVAIGFSLFTFWWVRLRRGKLEVAVPRMLGVRWRRDYMRLSLPLTFHNDGGRQIVVDDMRVKLNSEPSFPLIGLAATCGKVDSNHLRSGDNREGLCQFPVPAGESVQRICDFERQSLPDLPPRVKEYAVAVHGRMNGSTDWVMLCNFALTVPDGFVHGTDATASAITDAILDTSAEWESPEVRKQHWWN
jgi:hypothetical protein